MIKIVLNNVIILYMLIFLNSIYISLADYSKLVYGDDAYVTLYISPLLWSSGVYQRLVSKVVVDDISSVNLKGSWSSSSYSSDTLINSFGGTSWYQYWSDTTDTTETIGLGVAIECNGIISYQQGYRVIRENWNSDMSSITDKTGITFPILMAIITVTKGVVTVILYALYYYYCHYYYYYY
jgi:hypothetical protein